MDNSKIALKQPLNFMSVLHTTSKPESQTIVVQTILLTDCLITLSTVPICLYSSVSYVLSSSPVCIHRIDFVLVSTFTQSILDVCTPPPR